MLDNILMVLVIVVLTYFGVIPNIADMFIPANPETVVTYERLKELIADRHSGLVLIDVRAGYEFSGGAIPGAINIPSE